MTTKLTKRLARLTMFASATITLVACSQSWGISGKHTELEPTPPLPNEKITIVQYVREGNDTVMDGIQCRKFVLPEIEDLPELPDLDNIDWSNHVAVEHMLADHVERIRNHFYKETGAIRASYKAYLNECFKLDTAQ